MRVDSRSAAWERIGAQDPYFGVLHEPFRDARWGGSKRDEFFASGESYVEELFRIIRTELWSEFAPARALDFGCGVGRIAIPLARRADRVVGVDVSSTMLREAASNCEEMGLDNVALVLSDDALSRVEGSFDFVHSFIVFQHIAPLRGEAILRAMLDHLAPDGIGALHFTYRYTRSRWRALVHWMRKHLPAAHAIGNLVQGQPRSSPLIPMYNYDSDRLLAILQERGCHRLSLRFTQHGGYSGVILLFQKRSLPSL